MRISLLRTSLWTPPAETIVKTMAKYEYKDGERRTHKRIDIVYDLQGWYDIAFNRTCHWYIEMRVTKTIGRNPPGKTKTSTRRVYFPTITDAKDYIDEF